MQTPNFEKRMEKLAIGLYVAAAIAAGAIVYSACHEKHSEKANLAQNYSLRNK